MSDFPANPSDVSTQMGPSLAKRLNDADIFVAISYTAPQFTQGNSQPHHGPARLGDKIQGPQADLLRLIDLPTSPISAEPVGISTAGDEWVGGDEDTCEHVSSDELGIEDIEIIKNPGKIWSEIGAFSVIASDSTSRAIWVRDKPASHIKNGWDGEWRDYA
jgi:hypothetical protein